MAYLLICVRNQDTILNFAIFSRELAPVQFEHPTGLGLRHDPCTEAGQYFLIHHTHLVLLDENIENLSDGVTGLPQDNLCFCETKAKEKDLMCNVCGDKVPKREVIVPKLLFGQLEIERKLSLVFPSNLAYSSYHEIVNSRAFRVGFIRYLKLKTQGKWREGWFPVCECDEVMNNCDYGMTIPRLIEVFVRTPPVNVCHMWCNRVEGLARKRLILEETMAWLSTLGGGYSSLGDYFTHFSERAGQISVTQLRIAMEMGDPVMASKCRLFFGLSLMQRGELRKSKRWIRREYNFATSYKYRDQKLIDMCLGIWSKLQYLYSRRKKEKLVITTSGQNLSTACNSYTGENQTFR